MWEDTVIQAAIVRTDMVICAIVPILVVLLLFGAAAFLIHLIWKK